MNDFREFSKWYNNYLMHNSDRNVPAYGTKAYNKMGRLRYGNDTANMRPKDYIAKCVRNGMSIEDIIHNCELNLDPKYDVSASEKRFYTEVLRILNNSK